MNYNPKSNKPLEKKHKPKNDKDLNLEEKKKEYYSDEFIDEILDEKKTNINDYIDKVKILTKKIYEDISTSQLRNVFYEVKKAITPNDIHILRPKFAYISGKTDEKKKGMKIFLYLLEELAKKIDNEKKLNEFKNFFESIISYHKYYGGKD